MGQGNGSHLRNVLYFRSSMTVNPLANPKGLKLLCELCQKPAHVMCQKCRVTYYCTHEHQDIDLEGIHAQICASIKFLKSTFHFLSSEEERKKHADNILMKKLEIMELSRTTGEKLLFEGKHQHAVPAAMQSLKFAIDVYGLASVELVPSYLILGEASLGIGKLSQAEEYLSQAEWTVLKTPECPNSIKYKLFRITGLLYAAKGDFTDSLRSLADDIYHASLEYSPNDIHTSGGYFHMANVFFRLSEHAVADSLYTKITNIWFHYLRELIRQKTDDPVQGGDVPRREDPPTLASQGLDEAQQAEAARVLTAILEMRENVLKEPRERITLMYCLAMLYTVLEQTTKARAATTTAVDAIAADPDTAQTEVADGVRVLDKFLPPVEWTTC